MSISDNLVRKFATYGTSQATGIGETQREWLAALLERLCSSESGLESAEAERRLLEFGPNEPEQIHRVRPLLEFLHFCTNPLVMILLGAGIVSTFVGELVDGAIITAIVVLSIALNFFQTYRSQRAVKRLREQVAPTATALRDGNWGELPRSKIVPGDIVRLSAGDLVPADARLIESVHLHVQQAFFTQDGSSSRSRRRRWCCL